MTSKVVLLYGASAAGKTTLIAELEQIASASGVLTDMRVATRTTTAKTRPAEGSTIHREAFYKATHAGLIDVHWKRAASSGNVTEYGFSLARELERGGMLILSAHNFLDWTRQEPLLALRAEGRLMVVRIHASVNIRLRRLQAQRPKISQMELEERMADPPAESLPPADFVVLNDSRHEADAAEQLLQLLTAFRFYSLPFGAVLKPQSLAARN